MPAAWTQPLPVRRISEDTENPAATRIWPASLPAVRQLLADGLELGRSTILVGANGVGKSTLVEAIAMAFGMSGEGGGTGSMLSTAATESELHRHLRIERGPGGSRWGYFLRAETMHGLFSYLVANPRPDGRPDGSVFHRLSHGESFLALLEDPHRFAHGGLMIMDEPEAGLSVESQLTLLGHLIELSRHPQGQVIIATHSPVIAALPGARLIQLDEDGFADTTWDELSVVDHYRRFLAAPTAYLRHLVD